jgi:hypothetical protein
MNVKSLCYIPRANKCFSTYISYCFEISLLLLIWNLVCKNKLLMWKRYLHKMHSCKCSHNYFSLNSLSKSQTNISKTMMLIKLFDWFSFFFSSICVTTILHNWLIGFWSKNQWEKLWAKQNNRTLMIFKAMQFISSFKCNQAKPWLDVTSKCIIEKLSVNHSLQYIKINR